MKRKAPLKARVKATVLDYLSYPFRHPIGTAITVVGLSGLPGDVATWQRLIDSVTRDERVLALAEQAAHFGDWVSQPLVRAILISVGLVTMFWGLPWFWRLRHTLLFDWRRLLAEEVWIDRNAALKVLRNSTWGQLRKPVQSALASIALGFSDGMSVAERSSKKFAVYLDLTLASFATSNPSAVRVTDDKQQFEEGALRRFVEAAIGLVTGSGPLDKSGHAGMMIPVMTHIDIELDRISTRLASQPEPFEHAGLYAAQQALRWAAQPDNFASPYDVVTRTAADAADCSAGTRPGPLSETSDG